MKKPNELLPIPDLAATFLRGRVGAGILLGLDHSTFQAAARHSTKPGIKSSYDKDTEGRDVVTVRDFPSGIVIAISSALPNDRSYDLSFGRTPDGGSLIRTKDLRYTNSPWVPLYKYDVAFGRGVSDGNALVAVREWGKTNGQWITALRYRVSYERDDQGNITVKFGDWFKTNAALMPILKIPAHE